MVDHKEIHHMVFILNQIPHMYITSTLKFLEETLVSFLKIIEPCIDTNIQVIAQL